MANEFVPRKTDASMNPAARALPAAASTSVFSASIDLNAVDPLIADNFEIEVAAPALTTTMAPDTRIMEYAIQDSADDSSFADVITLDKAKQTGASSAGAPAVTVRAKLPSSVRRYIRLAVTSGASITDSSAVSATLKVRIAP